MFPDVDVDVLIVRPPECLEGEVSVSVNPNVRLPYASLIVGFRVSPGRPAQPRVLIAVEATDGRNTGTVGTELVTNVVLVQRETKDVRRPL